MPLRVLLWFLLSGAAPHTAGAAQSDVATITLTKPSCATCRIERRVVVEFGHDPAAQEAAPNGLIAVVAVGGGSFIGIAGGVDVVPFVFGGDGNLVRKLGRQGKGPGEFAGPGLVAPWRGDSTLIADPTAGRISVFDRGFKFARTFSFSPMYETWVPLSDGRLAVAGLDMSGPPAVIHLLDENGRLLTSFGAPTPRDSVAGFGAPRSLATDGRRVWTAPWHGGYRINEWDTGTRTKVRTFVRHGPEFPQRSPGAGISPTERPPGRLAGILRDGSTLWVLFHVAARDWARGLGKTPVTGEGGMKFWPVADADLVFDTIVEAIDLTDGRLLASARFDEAISTVASTGNVALERGETASGEPLSRVVRFELRRS